MAGRDSDYTTKVSPWPVADTVERLHALLSQRGMTVFATIDQGAAARSVGLQLRETVLTIFGNPASGTPIMDAAPLAALDLPLKLLIWADGEETKVSYLSPLSFTQRHDLTATLAAPITGIDALSDALIDPGEAAGE
jgi:uncharacterized protein (DUF302 family)